MSFVYFLSCLLFESSKIDLSEEIDQPPEAQINAPTGSETYYSDQPTQFSAIVFDAEDSVEELEISWTSDLAGELSLSISPNENGEISDSTLLGVGEHLIQLSVTDSAGNQTIAEVEVSVSGENLVPECAIFSPFDGARFIAGETIEFSGIATDANIPNEDLQVEWSSDNDGILGNSTPSSEGDASFSTTQLSALEHLITMKVIDDIAAECTDQVLIQVMNAPVVSILEPAAGSVVELGTQVLFEALVTDVEDPYNSIELEWSSSIDGILGTGNPDSQGTVYFVADSLSSGEHEIFLTAQDSDELVSSDDINLIVNIAPEIESIELSPSSPAPVGSVLCLATVFDDEDNLSFSYSFSNQTTGEEYTQISSNDSSASFDLSSTNIHLSDTLVCRVMVTDSAGATDSASTSVTVNAGSPYFTTPATISPNSGVVTGTQLQCSAEAEMYGQGPLTPNYQWWVSGSLVGTGSTFFIGSNNTDTGDIVACEAQATGTSGLTTSSFASVVVENTAPVISSINLEQSSSPSSILICSVSATDIDEDTLSYSFEFQNQSSSTSYGTGVVNHSSSTLDIDTTNIQAGDITKCIVTVSDGYSSQTDSTTITIGS